MKAIDCSLKMSKYKKLSSQSTSPVHRFQSVSFKKSAVTNSMRSVFLKWPFFEEQQGRNINFSKLWQVATRGEESGQFLRARRAEAGVRHPNSRCQSDPSQTPQGFFAFFVLFLSSTNQLQ